jgi:hypothetical protein
MHQNGLQSVVSASAQSRPCECVVSALRVRSLRLASAQSQARECGLAGHGVRWSCTRRRLYAGCVAPHVCETCCENESKEHKMYVNDLIYIAESIKIRNFAAEFEKNN